MYIQIDKNRTFSSYRSGPIAVCGIEPCVWVFNMAKPKTKIKKPLKGKVAKEEFAVDQPAEAETQGEENKASSLDRRTWMYVSVLVIIFGIIAFSVNMVGLGYNLQQSFDLAVKSHVISGIILIILGLILTKGKK